MTELAGSKTEANLRAALGMESEANRRYRYFAQQADVEGQPEAAEVFRAVAESETGHAFGHLDFLIDVPDQLSGHQLGETVDNLEAAELAERREAAELYPKFAAVAREEGFDEIADWLDSLGVAEAGNADRFAQARAKLLNDQI